MKRRRETSSSSSSSLEVEEAVEEEAAPVEAVDAAEARVGLVGEETAAASESECWMASSMAAASPRSRWSASRRAVVHERRFAVQSGDSWTRTRCSDGANGCHASGAEARGASDFHHKRVLAIQFSQETPAA